MAVVPRVPGHCRRSSAVVQARLTALRRFDLLPPSTSQHLLARPNRLRCPLRLLLSRKVRVQECLTRVETGLPLGKMTSRKASPTTSTRTNSKAPPTTPTRAISRARLMPRKKAPKIYPRVKIKVATLRVRLRIQERPSLTRCLGPRERRGGVRDYVAKRILPLVPSVLLVAKDSYRRYRGRGRVGCA